MRILLDECVPLPIRAIFVGHECIAVKEQGWDGIKNGQLLQLAEGEFDLFITADPKYSVSADTFPRAGEE